MLQVQLLRQDPDRVKKGLAVKNFADVSLVDTVLSLDEERKKLQLEFDNNQAKVNSASKEIGQLMAKGLKEEAEGKKKEVAALKETLQPISEKLTEVEKQLQDELVKLPNLPSELVPAGKTPTDNITVKEAGVKPKLPEGSVPHWELIKKYDIVDFETGARITGSGFPLYKGKGAKLQRALVQYFLDYNIAAGYTEYLPPFMVNEATAYGTGQLPDKEGQMYYMPADNFYMIPTAEVPVTNIYRDEILKEAELPVKMTAYSPCFRREAGSFGKDVRGLNRVHQFEKVEVVQLVHPEKSYDALNEMVSHVEGLLNTLELPYRILRLCGGDMSFASALTYDFEVYSAAQEKWLEVSSVSNFEAFQTNRMKIRFKDEKGKPQLVHSLNGSSLALPRILACILENNQTEDGIEIPKILWKYSGFKKLINKNLYKTIFHDYLVKYSYINENVNKLVIGTFPSVLVKKAFIKETEADIDFYYGSRENSFWKDIAQVFSYDFSFLNSDIAIQQIINFLRENKIGITDIYKECKSIGKASDKDLEDVVINKDIISLIENQKTIRVIYFTSQLAKNATIKMLNAESKIKQFKKDGDKRVQHFYFIEKSNVKREVKFITLPSPSRNSNRRITSDMRISFYRNYFISNP